MLKSFLLISLRNIRDNKGAAYLNIACLTLALATCLFIFNYISYEAGHDNYPGAENVYRVETQVIGNSASGFKDALSGSDAGPFLCSNFTELEQFTRLIPFSIEGTAFFRYQRPDAAVEQRVYIEKAYYAENSIFDLFPITLVEGDKVTALTTPNSLLISHSTAKRVFGKEPDTGASIVGKIFTTVETGISDNQFVITGIFEDLPSNSHLKFDALIAGVFPEGSQTGDGIQSSKQVYTYVLGSGKIEQSNTLKKGLPYTMHEEGSIFLRPVKEIHLSSGVSNNPEPGASRGLLIFLASLGVIILLLAITNYTNNTIFNSIERAKEIGIRKLLGIKPGQLIATFIGEALLINVIASIIAVFFYQFGIRLAPLFMKADKTSKVINPIEFQSIGEANLLANAFFLLMVLIVTTFLSSVYPAFYFNSLNPVHLLRGKLQLVGSRLMSGASKTIRSLLIFQLTAAIVFLSSVYIVSSQLRHLEQQRQEALELNVTGIFPGTSGANTLFTKKTKDRFRELIQKGRIRSVAFSNLYKGEIKSRGSVTLGNPGNPGDSPDFKCDLLVIDHHYWSETPEVFIAGQNFHSDFGLDPENLIINAAAVRLLGYEELTDIIGQTLRTNAGPFKVTGVVEDRNFREPSVFATGFRYRTYLDLDLYYPGTVGLSLSRFLHNTQVALSSPLPYFSLLTRDYQNRQLLEQNILKLFMFFTIVAVVIASIGMFALSSFISQKRTKEIGLRKILGATSLSAMGLLIYDFLKLVLIGSVFSIPLILYGSRIWLENYTYRITVGPLMVILPVLMILMVSFTVVSKKCWKTAIANPIRAIEVD